MQCVESSVCEAWAERLCGAVQAYSHLIQKDGFKDDAKKAWEGTRSLSVSGFRPCSAFAEWFVRQNPGSPALVGATFFAKA